MKGSSDKPPVAPSSSPPQGGKNPIDVFIGNRLKGLRVTRGLSQAEVGKKVNLSFQQIQKYEMGYSRITVAKLFELAEALDVPAEFLIKDAALIPCAEGKNLFSGEAWLLAGQFDQIKSAQTRRHILDLVKSLAGEETV